MMYDSGTNNEFVLTDADGNVMRFSESGEGLYYYDTNDRIGVALINTIKHNKSSYTDTDYHRALVACQLRIKIGRPCTKDFKNIITGNLLPNCPVTLQDIEMLMLCTLMELPCLLLSVVISSLGQLKVSNQQAQRT